MIGVLNYGMGNLQSVVNALDATGYDARVVASPAEIEAVS